MEDMGDMEEMKNMDTIYQKGICTWHIIIQSQLASFEFEILKIYQYYKYIFRLTI